MDRLNSEEGFVPLKMVQDMHEKYPNLPLAILVAGSLALIRPDVFTSEY